CCTSKILRLRSSNRNGNNWSRRSFKRRFTWKGCGFKSRY
ncbi:MAG: hypothetical protein ACI902_003122, partial [Psychroserpens sp.]